MARLPYLDPAGAEESTRRALEQLPPLNVFRMVSHAQSAFVPFLRFAGALLGELELDPQLRELAILRVAALTHAEYEWIQHVAIAAHLGLSERQIEAVRDLEPDPALFDAPQRAVLDFTAEFVERERPDDATFRALAERLPPRQIVELLLTAGTYLMLAKMMTTLDLDVDKPIGGSAVDQVVTQARD
jgi:alkylhydroperoxidase family enzyme